ncbi:hypothetical protein HK100_003890 [Physocladia obscura]|uniref:Uncharacterized protein n=1 Tax=Physocladia obscura TaxID=109957 RepID=A0AAD5STS2_9FUNG|nr:hypothetical protein HK100_003890 [Physocladia obscura]
MSTLQDRDRRRRLSAALGAARSPSATRSVSSGSSVGGGGGGNGGHNGAGGSSSNSSSSSRPQPPSPLSPASPSATSAATPTSPASSPTPTPKRTPKAHAPKRGSDSSSSSSSSSDDDDNGSHGAKPARGVAELRGETARERAARVQAETLRHIARNSNWDADLVSLVVREVEGASASASASGAGSAAAGSAVARRVSTSAFVREPDEVNDLGDTAATNTATTAATTTTTAATNNSKTRTNAIASAAEPNLPITLPLLPLVRRDSSRFGKRHSISVSASASPAPSSSASTTTTNDDTSVRQRARDRIRRKSFDVKTVSLSTLSLSSDLAEEEDTIMSITSGYDGRLREIIMETISARKQQLQQQNQQQPDGNSGTGSEFIPLNDEEELPYVNPRMNQSRAMSSPSIRMIRKRSSIVSQLHTEAKSLLVKENSAIAKKPSKSSLLNDVTVEDDDEVPYNPPLPPAAIRGGGGTNPIRKRVSVLQSAISQPTLNLESALKIESSENFRSPPLLPDSADDNTYIRPVKITPRTASSASIDMLKRRSSGLYPENSISTDEATIAAIEQEVLFAGQIDPETGIFLQKSRINHNNDGADDIVVTASGIKKEPAYSPPSQKFSRAASTPHIKAAARKSLPVHHESNQGSALKTFLESQSGEQQQLQHPQQQQPKSDKQQSPSMVHPALSLPRPPKPNRNSYADPSWASKPPKPTVANLNSNNNYGNVTATSSNSSSTTSPPRLSQLPRSTTADARYATPTTTLDYQVPAPPARIRRESTIGIAAAAAGSAAVAAGNAASSAISYLTRVASSYLEQQPATATTLGIANNADGENEGNAATEAVASPSTLASAFAYFTGPVSPKPVVEPPQLYGQARVPIRMASSGGSSSGGATSNVGGVSYPPRLPVEAGLGSVVEEWWKRFGKKD